MSSSNWTAEHIPDQHGRVAIVTGAIYTLPCTS